MVTTMADQGQATERRTTLQMKRRCAPSVRQLAYLLPEPACAFWIPLLRVQG